MSAKVNRIWNCNDPACVVYLTPPKNSDGYCLLLSFFKPYQLDVHDTFFPPLIQWADLFLCESGCRATSHFRNNSITDWQSECVTDLFLSACRSRLILENTFFLFSSYSLKAKTTFCLKACHHFIMYFVWCTYKLGRCFSLQRTNSGSYGQNSSESWIDTIGPKSKRFMWAHLIRSLSDVCIITISIFHCWQRTATAATLSWLLNHRWMNTILRFLIIKKVIKSKTIHLHCIF